MRNTFTHFLSRTFKSRKTNKNNKSPLFAMPLSQSPSTFKAPSNNLHAAATFTPSRPYMRACKVTVKGMTAAVNIASAIFK
jgi:hypothetical protein